MKEILKKVAKSECRGCVYGLNSLSRLIRLNTGSLNGDSMVDSLFKEIDGESCVGIHCNECPFKIKEWCLKRAARDYLNDKKGLCPLLGMGGECLLEIIKKEYGV